MRGFDPLASFGEDVAAGYDDSPIAGEYRLVYLVFNSIYNLLSQDDQVRCFANVARHLGERGVFLIEAALPGPGETQPGPTYYLDEQYVAAEEVARWGGLSGEPFTSTSRRHISVYGR